LFKHILILTDGSELAVKAAKKGVFFAQEIGAKITAVTVTEPFPSVSAGSHDYAPIEYTKLAQTHAEEVLGAVLALARAEGVPCDTLRIEHTQVYQAIIAAASARGCDLIVMASHGRRGVAAVVLGSETVKVLTHSKTPVLVYR
jgi:nucleotide-binding universal stress UspA family protein